MGRVALVLMAALVSTPLEAQWLKQPTAGIPRTGDGKPNLSAPAPRTTPWRSPAPTSSWTAWSQPPRRFAPARSTSSFPVSGPQPPPR